jgi:CheY-like chemotaxis protein
MRILVLDDNPDVVKVVQNFLKTLDHEVSAYTDGTEALLWIKDVKPELIIADLEMPTLDGFTFLKRVKAYPSLAAVPFICITGTDATDEQIAASGFTATLRKPITLSDLMQAISEVQSVAHTQAAG